MSPSGPSPFDALHPIDIAESLAEHHAWEFDRIAEDRIALAVAGRWRGYALTLSWSDWHETLRLVCTFDLAPAEDRLAPLHELINRVNDGCWSGSFVWWPEQRLMSFQYGLLLGAGALPEPDQIDRMIAAAVVACERFYPAFQMVAHGDSTVEQALSIAMTEAYGTA